MYVGSSKFIKNRCYQHKNKLLVRKHTNVNLERSVHKYGIENFEFIIIETHTDPTDDNLTTMEDFWIDYYKQRVEVYNIRLLARNNSGLKHNDVMKTNQSKRARDWWRNNKGVASVHAKELWNDPVIRQKMIEGHCKYEYVIQNIKTGELVSGNYLKETAMQIGLPERGLHKLVAGQLKTHHNWKLVSVIKRGK